jgi:Mg-chelatase subunit ChlI
VERRVAFEQDPESFYQEWLPREEQLSIEIAEARTRLPMVAHTQRDLFTIAQLTTSFKVDGHRADIVILKTARAHAALIARTAINEQDIMLAPNWRAVADVSPEEGGRARPAWATRKSAPRRRPICDPPPGQDLPSAKKASRWQKVRTAGSGGVMTGRPHAARPGPAVSAR